MDVLVSKFKFCFRRSRVLNVSKEMAVPQFEMTIYENISMVKTVCYIARLSLNKMSTVIG